MTDNGKKKKIIIAAVVAVLLIIALIIFLIFRGKIRATTMRLLRIEGTVTMQEDGKNKDVRENLRLKSGNALDTAASSLVSIGLDDHKIVTMDELSRAEFNQEGKYLNLNLTKGSIFFEVDKALAADESFEIETSTMIVGIRGTSGWVSVSGEHESLIITDGHVHVVGTNPVTGEVKEIDVNAGQRITVYLYNDRTVDSIMFELEDITERDLPEFVLKMLRSNSRLLDRVVGATGWDKPWILGLDDTEPEDDGENGNSGNNTTGNANTDNTGNNEGDGIADVGGNDDVPGDVGGNDDAVTDNTDNNAGNNAADNNNANNAAANEPAPAVAPEKTALEQQIEAAQAQIVSENADGTITLIGGNVFDPDFYASRYPDVAAAYGTGSDELLAHYVAIGQSEGRYATDQEEREALVAAAIAELEAKAEYDRLNALNNPQPANNTQNTQQTNTQQTNTQQTNTQQTNTQQTNTQQQQQTNTQQGAYSLNDGSTVDFNSNTRSFVIMSGPTTGTTNTVTLPTSINVGGTQMAVDLSTLTVDPNSGVTRIDATAVANSSYIDSGTQFATATNEVMECARNNSGVAIEGVTATAINTANGMSLTIKTSNEGHPGLVGANSNNPDGGGAYEIGNFLNSSGITLPYEINYGNLTMQNLTFGVGTECTLIRRDTNTSVAVNSLSVTQRQNTTGVFDVSAIDAANQTQVAYTIDASGLK